MAQQTINVGTSPNDGTGTPLRTAFQYTNSNFSELYTAVGPSGNNIVVPGTATITGDLTVDTSTLKVDSANNRVSINTTTFATDSVFAVKTTAGKFDVRAAGSLSVKLNSDQSMLYNVPTGNSHLFQINDSDAMTLNSTGLGVGRSPLTTLDVFGANKTNTNENGTLNVSSSDSYAIDKGGSIAFFGKYNSSSFNACFARIYGAKENSTDGSFTGYFAVSTSPGGTPVERFRIDSSGNVGVGVTPSAWGSNYTPVELTKGAAIWGAKNIPYTIVGANVYNDATNEKYVVSPNTAATKYQQTGGVHSWYNAAAGAAGTAITFTQAMTLDASGNLLVAKSTAGALGTVGHEIKANGEVFATQSASTNVATTYHAYSSGAAAYRFYVGLGGTVYATNTTISAISDARLKENVQDIDVGLGAILALKPRKFDWKAGKGKDIKGDRGFIAQEFETVFPNLIDEWKDNAPEGEAPYKSVRQDLIPVLVKAIQELAAEVNALKNA